MTRVWSGAALIVFAVAAVWWAPAPAFIAIAELVLVLACREYACLVTPKGATLPFPFWCAAAALTCAAVAVPSPYVPHTVALLLATLIGGGAIAVFRWHGEDALAAVAVSTFATLYLGLPLGVLVLVRDQQGASGLFLLVVTVMVSDTAQYYTGRALGRRPLAPDISPKKTVEGAIGGVVAGSLAFAVLAGFWLDRPAWSVGVRIGLGATLVAAGIIGDLFESMLKRRAEVKDSSSLIPGHGGVLDRIDALLFAAPVYFIALTYL